MRRELIPDRHWGLAHDQITREIDVWVQCPGCGCRSCLAHDVGAGGEVSPSLECPFPHCAFHAHVVLAGWMLGEWSGR